MTVPLPGHLHAQRENYKKLADLGYTDIWSAEADGADAFTPLAMAAAWDVWAARVGVEPWTHDIPEGSGSSPTGKKKSAKGE